MTRALALAALCAAATAAPAQEPLSMKGLGAAASRAQVLAQFPDLRCHGDDCVVVVHRACGNVGVVEEPRRQECAARYSYAGANVQSWSARFHHDVLEHLTVSFPADEFEPVARALAERFGEPQKTGTTLRWRATEAVLAIDRGARTATVFLFNLKAMAERKREQQQRDGHDAKDRAKNL